MKTSLIRAASLCALLAGTALVTPAFAQSVPAPYKYRDANGVDLVTGGFSFSLIEGRIGSGKGELVLDRLGWDKGTWQNTYLQQTMSGTVTSVQVVLGDRSETFTSGNGSGFLASQGNGATLTGGLGGNYIYKAADGTQTVFGAPTEDQGGASPFCAHVGSDPSNCKNLALSVASEDGTSVDFNWNVHSICSTVFNEDGSLDCDYAWRLGSVSNSSDYAIAFAYATNSVPFRQFPSPDWFKRTSASLVNAQDSSATGMVTYSSPAANVTDITDIGGRVWRLTADTSGRIVGVRRPGASSDTTTIGYGANGVTSVTRNGVTTNYARSVSGNNATMVITNALGQQTTIVSDVSKGRPVSITDGLGRTTSFTYDGFARLTRTTRPEGNYVELTYDDRGNATQTRAVAKAGSGLADIVTMASYPAACANPATCNSPTSITDARGQVTDYTYDATHGGLLTVTAPAMPNGVRPQTRFSYTVASNGEYRLTGISACQTQSSCASSADEAKTTIAYDAKGNVTSVTSGSGNGILTAARSMTYDGQGKLLTVDGPLAGTADTVLYRYNSSRELIGTISPDPDGAGALKHRALRNTINNEGLVTKFEAGTVNSQSDSDWATFTSLEAVEIGYDGNARPVTQKLVAGGTTYALTQTSYDAVGRVECSAQRMNPAAFASLPTSACTLGTQGSFGPDRINRTVYDVRGNVHQQISAYGTADQATEMTIDYTDNGIQEDAVDAKGNRSYFAYDGHDRLAASYYPSKTVPGEVDWNDFDYFEYDASGNVTRRRNRDAGNIFFTYDNLNRLTFKDLPGSEPDVTHGYDNLGRMTSASQSGHAVSFAYDALGRNLTQGQPLGIVSSAWDLAGGRTRITHPDTSYWNLFRDNLGSLTAVKEWDNDPIATFAQDNLGRRTSRLPLSGMRTLYEYDGVSRLDALTHTVYGGSHDVRFDYDYNPASQITSNTRSNDLYAWTGHGSGSTASSVNGLNQLVTNGGASVIHDPRGNITNDGLGRTYVYDSQNRLISSTAAGVTTTLSYDPLGRLVSVSGPSGTTRFAYDGHDIISEHNGAGTLLRRYVHGDGVDEPLVSYESGRRNYHADERGSIIALSDDAGTVTNLNKYDEYGVPQGSLAGRFGYTGQAWVPEIGLYHYKARMYHPKLGRFMQADPIGYEAGMNLYNYVGSDPVNFIDPTGKCYAENWSMHIYDAMGNDLGPDPVNPESWAVLVGCDKFSMPRLNSGFPGVDGGAVDAGEEIVVNGKRPRRVTVLPNTDGTFRCIFVGGRNVWISFRNHGPTNRADVGLSSYPAYSNGEAIPQFTNPGRNPFFEQRSSYIFHLATLEFHISASATSATGLYSHLATGRRHQQPVNELDQFLTVTIHTDGGFGGCV